MVPLSTYQKYLASLLSEEFKPADSEAFNQNVD